MLGGKNIADIVTRWQIGAAVGAIYMAQIDVLDDPSRVEIVRADTVAMSMGPRTAVDGSEVHHPGIRFGQKDRVLIDGSDISSWIAGYDRITRAGSSDIIRLHVHCDSDVLSINGTTPWEQEGS